MTADEWIWEVIDKGLLDSEPTPYYGWREELEQLIYDDKVGSWFFVITENTTFIEIYNWIKEININNWHHYDNTYIFKNEKDAALFKLVWG